MGRRTGTLLCWHAERAGIEVLDRAIKALQNRRIDIDRVLYLVQATRTPDVPAKVGQAVVEPIDIALEDPTQHAAIYEQMRDVVLPRLRSVRGGLHINVSPGTPAMHSVWLMLHAGGALPEGTQLWSSQMSRETSRVRIDPVDFSITTYLAEIQRVARLQPQLAVYEAQARSPARRQALERLARYARVFGAPLLILGERGTGKTRLVETFIATLKGRKSVVTVPCGGLDSALAESLLFGHRKGAFTGAAGDRPGLLKEANGGILFLDEVQDLPKPVQRKLVRVFQDRQRRYRPVGSDREESVDVELVCASNLPLTELRERVDADLFDRLSHLSVTVPPLRECREDCKDDWNRVWQEFRERDDFPADAPWEPEIEGALQRSPLMGNLRDLQRLALLCMAWWSASDQRVNFCAALDDWLRFTSTQVSENSEFGEGTRAARIRWFRDRLAKWAKDRHGTWSAAAKALSCDEKTLRLDSVSAMDNVPDSEVPFKKDQ
ncbi:sigma 54-interacting transcriptional regulator [Rhodoferax sp. U2-2l]|uniref:sigma-54-dependent transcriptional regulator n=1 Tax=Rhodoferax sp. U2-2l TaxID=2884000 RepID=UPI001D0A408E|nr:sigma 54-interacting transcriptional regulator [Rhodoferax sp. U2-2l]MCB8748926.1 sigma 54-interacting transcriptional regulator [Rhodoferax sp. U2-2l]